VRVTDYGSSFAVECVLTSRDGSECIPASGSTAATVGLYAKLSPPVEQLCTRREHYSAATRHRSADVSQRDARLMANRMSAAGATLTRMAFKMNRSGPEPALEFDDRDKFEALSGGVLKISRPDKRNLYITP
jgi:hypothetical protein